MCSFSSCTPRAVLQCLSKLLEWANIARSIASHRKPNQWNSEQSVERISTVQTPKFSGSLQHHVYVSLILHQCQESRLGCRKHETHMDCKPAISLIARPHPPIYFPALFFALTLLPKFFLIVFCEVLVLAVAKQNCCQQRVGSKVAIAPVIQALHD